MEEGLHIQVNGYISVYEKRGEYQIVALDARPVGKGALILAFEQLKEKLSKKGFFDSERKKRIPLLPEKIGIATSIGGAVLKDMVSVLKKRFPNFHLIVRNVNVGGMTSAAELCQAIDDLCQYGVDVIIIARGGGSLEDLWGFNSEELACSIYECQVPVISAVGHQTDFTISDFVADLRAATPSIAAENVILDKEKISRDIRGIRSALMERSMGLVQNNRRYLSSLIDRKYFTRPQTILGTRYQDAGIFQRELKDNISSILNIKRQVLSQSTSRIVPDRIRSRIVSYRLALKNNSLRWRNGILNNIGDKKKTAGFILESLEKNSPTNIIKRGFAVIYDSGMKKSLSSSDMINSGEEINIQLKDGRIRAKVLEILKNKLFKSGKQI
jgi:exodeoxyribonuclease VII large subunit